MLVMTQVQELNMDDVNYYKSNINDPCREGIPTPKKILSDPRDGNHCSRETSHLWILGHSGSVSID